PFKRAETKAARNNRDGKGSKVSGGSEATGAMPGSPGSPRDANLASAEPLGRSPASGGAPAR
ncbi:hypothetical protein AKJ65_05605, partial [candidate division MSBL1 archaeon SCGC-AAA259E19]